MNEINILDCKLTNDYKKTSFGFIPKDWKVVKLKDITNGKGTYGIGAAGVEYNENLPRYLRITDIDEQGRIINDDPKCVDSPEAYKYILKKNDIVFARTGNTTGKTYLYNESDGKLVYAGFLIKFSIDPSKADSRYVKYFTETNYYWQWVSVMSMRSGQPGINENDYAKLPILIPPTVKEQNKISNILSTWDKAIELKEKLIEQKKEQKKGLMQKLLTGEVRLPGFKEKWEKKKVEDLITESKEVAKNPSLDKRITVRLNLMGVQKREVSAIEKEGATTQYVRRAGQFIYGKQNLHKGALGLVPKELDGYQSSSDIPSFDFKKGICGLWFYYYFSRESFYTNLERIATGTGSKRIHPNDLFMVKIFVPPFEEQKKISEVLKCMDEEILFYQKELENLKQQKKGLMQLLLTGKVRVKV